MANATNKTIKKVFKSKEIPGQYGPQQIYDVYFEGSKNKYSYFQSGKKPVPTVGMMVSYMEFEVKKDGQYTNRTIKKLVIDETAPQKPQDAPQTKNGGQAYINHGECVIELMKMAGGVDCQRGVLEALVEVFRSGIEAMIKPPDYPKEEDFEPSQDVPEDMDSIPF